MDDLVIDLQPVGVEKLRIALDQLVAHLVRGIGENKVDEHVPELPDVLHCLRGVELDVLATLDAEPGEMTPVVVCLGNVKCHLGGHTAEARTGGTQPTAIDQHIVVGNLANLFDCIEAGMTGTDHSHVYVSVHAPIPRKQCCYSDKGICRQSHSRISLSMDTVLLVESLQTVRHDVTNYQAPMAPLPLAITPSRQCTPGVHDLEDHVPPGCTTERSCILSCGEAGILSSVPAGSFAGAVCILYGLHLDNRVVSSIDRPLRIRARRNGRTDHPGQQRGCCKCSKHGCSPRYHD